MPKANINNQNGFTILELMIATMVFSLILLLAAYSLLHIGNTYTKGTNLIATQDTARNIIENLSQAIQFNGAPVGSPPTGPLTTGALYCFNIGSVRYTFVYNQQLTSASGPGLVRDDSNNSCPSPVSWPPQPFTEMLGQRMRISKLDISQINSSNLYKITVRVLYGEDSLINGDNCKPGAGSQFCAAKELSTVVQKRI